MKIFRSFEEAAGIRNPVVTTGSFDGVHIGHKAILRRLAMLADKHGGESVLITFDPHPRKVLYPETAGRDLKLINSQEEKLHLLAKAGLDNIIIINFTHEFSHITSEAFVRDLLCGILHARVIVVGFNHHFGFNKEGDYKQLWGWRGKYGFEAEEIPEQEVQHETVSSTKIRQAISEGYIQRANAYLDHYYIVKGTTKTLPPDSHNILPGLIRVPVTEECKILPAPGIYAVSVDYGSAIRKAMAIIQATKDGLPDLLLNVFDEEENIDRMVTVSFHKKIHGEVNLSDENHSSRISSALAEIMDLIY